MRLWAEERRGGTIELLFTLPVTLWEAVAGKFLAAWCFTGIALALTFPMWVTVNILGEPGQRSHPGKLPRQLFDGWRLHGDRLIRVGPHQESGDRLRDQRGGRVGVRPQWFFPWCWICSPGGPRNSSWNSSARSVFLTHFNALSRGVVDLRDLVYFLSLIGFWLFATALMLEWKKAE